MNQIWKSKTFWTGIAGICTAVGAYVEGSIGVSGLVAGILGSLSVIFMRMGVSKSGVPPLAERGVEVK